MGDHPSPARGETITAGATAPGGRVAMLRLSGPAAVAVAAAAGLVVPAAGHVATQDWPLAGGHCPCRVLFAAAPRSATGHDVVEVVLPGASDLVDLALAALVRCGATPAAPGGFTRQALANGRLTLDQAEAALALALAGDAASARRALERLRGALAGELGALRTRLIDLRARVEAGLDFLDEPDVRAYDPVDLRGELAMAHATVARWLVAAAGQGGEPVVCLVGPANAGKSALYAALTGERALVSTVAGTTRDPLAAEWVVANRRLRLVDTAGWLAAADGIDHDARTAGDRALAGAALVLVCSAPDARLPDDLTALPAGRCLIIATKADLAATPDARAALAVSAKCGSGLADLAALVADALAASAPGEPRQARLLAETAAILAPLATALPGDELLADDLLRIADLLGDLLGATTTDDVLDAIFARFCIGK